MNMFCRVAVSVTCSLAPFAVAAQDFRPGYVISHSGDSTAGFVAYGAGKKFLTYCLFKTSKRGKAERYYASEISAYGIVGDKQFISIASPGDGVDTPVFVRVLAGGSINLYRYGKTFLVKKDGVLTWLPLPVKTIIETSNGRMVKEDKRYVGALNTLIADCQLSADESTYSEPDLTRLIVNYNRCKGIEPAFAKPRPLARINGEVFGSFVWSSLTTKISEPLSFSPSQTIAGGAGIDYSCPRIFDRFFVTIEAWYVKSFYQSYTEGPASGGYRYKDTFFDVTNVRIPLGFRYNFLKESSTPYVKIGFTVTAYQKLHNWSIVERETGGGLVITDNYEGGYDITKPRGIWLSVGYDRLVCRKAKAFVEFRYEDLDGFIGTPIQTFSTMKNINLMLGVRF